MKDLSGDLSIHHGGYRRSAKGDRPAEAGETGVCFRQVVTQQNVTRVNAEQASRPAMREPPLYSGKAAMISIGDRMHEGRPAEVLAMVCWEGKTRNMRNPSRLRRSTSNQANESGLRGESGGSLYLTCSPKPDPRVMRVPTAFELAGSPEALGSTRASRSLSKAGSFWRTGLRPPLQLFLYTAWCE